jgi:CCR4-NOT transcription complex subunit 7/8
MQESSPPSINIREVWSHNLESEFSLIRALIDDFPFVAMDTEFPGVTIRVLFPSPVTLSHLNYQTLRANVDLLHMIQLGLAFSDENGTLPVIEGRPSVWQFNFKEFDLEKDIFDPESIDLLKNHGIDLYKHHTYGVDAGQFAELLMSSGVVLNDSVVWITFHGGYDFGYLLKSLTASKLPETLEGFAELSKTFFPVFYDVKHLMRYCPGQGFHGGLNRLSDALSVERVGICHQAGSDALLTLRCFLEMLEKKYVSVPLEKYAGVLYGTGDDYLQVLKV